MMDQPCSNAVMDHAVTMFNAFMNTIQIVLVAWLTKRAYGKDVAEKMRNGAGSH